MKIDFSAYQKAHEEFEKAEEALKNEQLNLKPIISKYLHKYEEEEKEICKKYNIPRYSIYDYFVKFDTCSWFIIRNEDDESYTIDCVYEDDTDESIYSTIVIPKDSDNDEKFLQQFREKILLKFEKQKKEQAEYLRKQQEHIKAKREEMEEEFEMLRKAIEEIGKQKDENKEA